MNVLLVCRSFPAHRTGGMESHTQHILDGLISRGHEVVVLTSPLPRTSAADEFRRRVHLLEIGHAGGGGYDLQFFREAASAAAYLCRRHRIDIVHAQGFAGIPLVFAEKELPPVLTTIHGTLWSETPLDRRTRSKRGAGSLPADAWRFRHRIAFWPVWRTFLQRTPALITDSRFTARELRRENPKLQPAIVPLGFETARFREQERMAFDAKRCALVAPSDDRPVLLFAAGRLTPQKGLELLPRMMRRLHRDRNVHLVIGGEGPEGERLRNLAREWAPDRIHFTGRISDEELPRWFAAADVFLNPETGHPAFGLVNAEALCAGTPVITTPHGAHPEVVRAPGDGLLVTAERPQLWAQSVRVVLEREEKQPEARRARADRAAARFDRETMIARLEEEYRRAAAAQSAAN